MTVTKRLGIWMDHSTAHLMEFTTGQMETKKIDSDFTHEVKVDSLGKSEHIMHNKEQQQQSGYYKKLAEVIKNYEEVILFGPTDAKIELLNKLKTDQHFDKIKIEVKSAEKMTKNQQQAFVREYFTNL